MEKSQSSLNPFTCSAEEESTLLTHKNYSKDYSCPRFVQKNLTYNRATLAYWSTDDLWRITKEGEVALIMWEYPIDGLYGALVCFGDSISFNLPKGLSREKIKKYAQCPYNALELRPDLMQSSSLSYEVCPFCEKGTDECMGACSIQYCYICGIPVANCCAKLVDEDRWHCSECQKWNCES